MQIKNKVVVVTGAANGIGKALAKRFHDDQAAAVIISDVDHDSAAQLAMELDETVIACDVSREEDVQQLVRQTVEQFGRIDLFCSNAGITIKGGLETTNSDWQAMWDINLMSHVYAARAVVPTMQEQQSGYLLQTISAAGLLTEIGSASYSVTKHAALAFAEWLSIEHGRDGIGVSCLCPMGVETNMLDEADPIHQFLQLSAISPTHVADVAVKGLANEEFLILPHDHVAEFLQYKTEDYDRWIDSIQQLRDKLERKKQRRTQKKLSA